jgi:antitoxin CcdA
VTVRADLVRRARELELNLSALLEAAIEQAIRDAERQRWLEENRAAIRSANEHFEKHGLFSDDWREFE